MNSTVMRVLLVFGLSLTIYMLDANGTLDKIRKTLFSGGKETIDEVVPASKYDVEVAIAMQGPEANKHAGQLAAYWNALGERVVADGQQAEPVITDARQLLKLVIGGGSIAKQGTWSGLYPAIGPTLQKVVATLPERGEISQATRMAFQTECFQIRDALRKVNVKTPNVKT